MSGALVCLPCVDSPMGQARALATALRSVSARPMRPMARFPRIHFDHGVDPAQWEPLIDGTYAIILTLLVIELPILLLDLLRDFNHQDLGPLLLLEALLRLFLGYLAVFLVVFDIWSKKRRLLEVLGTFGVVSKFESVTLLLSLFLASLLPPLYYVLNQLRLDYSQQAVRASSRADVVVVLERIEIDITSLIFFAVGIAIYALIAMAAHLRLCRMTPLEQRQRLKGLRFDALVRLALAFLILPLYTVLPTPFPGVLYAITGFWRLEPAGGLRATKGNR